MSNHIAIIGAGWAGLAAAVELAPSSPVTIFEAAKQAGGRARKSIIGGLSLDNGQHLMLGAYNEWLCLLKRFRIAEEEIFMRLPLQLHLCDKERKLISLNASSLPAPLNLFWGLLTIKGIPCIDRLSAIPGIRHMLNRNFAAELSVENLLALYNQPETVCRTLWRPLCVATLNTHSHQASADIFVNILCAIFNRSQNASDLLIPKKDLNQCFPDPAIKYIMQHNGTIHYRCKVTAIHEAGNKIAISSNRGEQLFDRIILATPAWTAKKMMQKFPACKKTVTLIEQLDYAPICTIYLLYPEETTLPYPMLGFLDTVIDWAFDRIISNQAGMISVVISAGGKHMNMKNADLIQQVQNELAHQFPHWPEPINAWITREKRATFSCYPDIQSRRPDNQTGHGKIILAGDYTYDAFPATLETAIRSGLRAAKIATKKG